MKKLFIYFLLLNMINTTFIVGENHDIVSFEGIGVVNEEEYNSLLEYIMEACLDMPDNTPEDEDDDIPDGFKSTHIGDYFFIPGFEFMTQGSMCIHHGSSFYIVPAYSCYLEKNSPPPKLA